MKETERRMRIRFRDHMYIKSLCEKLASEENVSEFGVGFKRISKVALSVVFDLDSRQHCTSLNMTCRNQHYQASLLEPGCAKLQ